MHACVVGAVPRRFLPTIDEVGERDDEEIASMCDGGGSMTLQRKVEITEPIARDMSPEH